jgi:hypothetical protein
VRHDTTGNTIILMGLADYETLFRDDGADFSLPTDGSNNGLNFEFIKSCPPAHDVFSEQEMDERIAMYAARFEARLPLFGDGKPGPVDEEQFRCCGCDVLPPFRREKNGNLRIWATGRPQRMQPRKAPGWVREVVPISGEGGGQLHTISLSWCPACAAMTGYGCSEEQETENKSSISLVM